MRIGLVLSGGGLRGVAHLGVLRSLVRHHIPIDVIVGVSAGAIIGAYYAAVGLSIDELLDDVPSFRGRHLLMHGVTLRAHASLKPHLRKFCGIIPTRLAQLERARFDVLHHGVERLGIVCHDVTTNRPSYFSTLDHHGLSVSDIARASAAVPGVFPPKTVTIGDTTLRLADGGIGDSLPVDFARSRGLDATHLIVSDCRLVANAPPREDDRLIYLRPQLDGVRTMRGPRAALMQAVSRGEAAVAPSVLRRLDLWSAALVHAADGALA